MSVDQATVRVPLPRGLFALVDTEDAPRVLAYRWHLKRKRNCSRIYAQRSTRLSPGRDGKRGSIQLHRFVLDAQPGQVVDHRNGDTLDNRRVNLRITDNRGNATNVTRSKNQKRGGFKGVSWNRNAGRWSATICAGDVKPNGRRRQLYLGLFENPEDAARAYDAAALERFGEFASLNFPGELSGAGGAS